MSNELRKRNLTITFSLFFFVIFLSQFNITGVNNESNLNLANTSSLASKIFIDGNEGWVNFRNLGNCTGSGISSDPYIIQDIIIDGGGLGNCIEIYDSTVYFKIENCTLINSGGQTTNAGIYFNNVQNGKIVNCLCKTNENGIYLLSSDGNEIKNNFVTKNDAAGIRLEQGNNNLISGNNVTYNIYSGIYVVCPSSIITRNIVDHNGYFEIFAFFSDHSIISENTADAIIIYNSNYITVSKNTVNFNVGIFLSHSNFTEIIDNTLNHNFFEAMRISESKNNEISGNTLNYNSHGISLYRSKENKITENTLTSNDYGVYVTSSDHNNISKNIFIFNNVGINLDSSSKCNEVLDNEFSGNYMDVQDNQGSCFTEIPIPILEIVAIAITIVSLIGVLIFILRKRSLKRKILTVEKPLISISENEPISQEELIETSLIPMELKHEDINERSLQEELPALQEQYQFIEEDVAIHRVIDTQDISSEEVKENLAEGLKEESSVEEKSVEEIISPVLAQEQTPEIKKEEIITEEEPKEDIISPPVTEEIIQEVKKVPLSVKKNTMETVPVSITHEITCQYCGFSIEENASFCRQCGQIIKKRK